MLNILKILVIRKTCVGICLMVKQANLLARSRQVVVDFFFFYHPKWEHLKFLISLTQQSVFTASLVNTISELYYDYVMFVNVMLWSVYVLLYCILDSSLVSYFRFRQKVPYKNKITFIVTSNLLFLLTNNSNLKQTMPSPHHQILKVSGVLYFIF